MQKKQLLLCLLALAAMVVSFGCNCGDDDDDGSPADDDVTDDDTVDDDIADDDITDDDVTDDDTSVEPLPTVNCVPPVDYDGDGDNELLMLNVDHNDSTYNVFLVEPGSYQRELILTYPTGAKQGGPHPVVADLDQNGVWDIVMGTLTTTSKLTMEVTYEVFMNGDFDEPAYFSGPHNDTMVYIDILDTDQDGEPEILLATIWGIGGTGELILIDPGEDFAQTATINFDCNHTTNFLTPAEPGSIFRRAANFSGEAGAAHLAVLQIDDDLAHNYARLLIYDLATGDEIAQSPDIDLYASYDVNAWVADYDNDGLTEIMLTKSYYDPTAEATYTAQLIVYGGLDFTPEFTGSEYADSRASWGFNVDFNMDEVVDPLLIYTDPSGSSSFYNAFDATNSYTQLFSFGMSGDYRGNYIPYPGRGNTAIGYSFAGSGQPDAVFYRQHSEAGPVRTGELILMDVTTGTPSAVLNSFPLGASGQAIVELADVGGDGVLDLAVMAKQSLWNGVDWEYQNDLYVYQGAEMTQVLTADYGTDGNIPLVITTLDLDGDWAADLMIEVTSGTQQINNIYSCTAGSCEFVDSISYGLNEYFFFVGPML